MRKFLPYTAGLIALYLIAAHASGSGTVITSGASGVGNVIKTLQGR
jgi:hypothetical protein